jgi:hypothetical protein
LDFGFGEEAGEFLIGVEAVDGAAGEVGEVEAVLGVVGEVVGAGEGLSFEVVGEDFDFARFEVGAGEAGLHGDGGVGGAAELGAFEGGSFASDEVAGGIDEEAVGGVAVFAEDGELAGRGELEDALVDGFGEVDVVAGVGGGAFGEGGDGGGGGFEFFGDGRGGGAGGEEEGGEGAEEGAHVRDMISRRDFARRRS